MIDPDKCLTREGKACTIRCPAGCWSVREDGKGLIWWSTAALNVAPVAWSVTKTTSTGITHAVVLVCCSSLVEETLKNYKPTLKVFKLETSEETSIKFCLFNQRVPDYFLMDIVELTC